jgi:hypothetical protein
VSKSLKVMLENSVKEDLILTPVLDEFLVTWDGTVPEHIAQLMARLMSTKQRDRRYTWSASAAGHCLRRQEFAFLGMPQNGATDPRMQQIFRNGTWVHMRWQATLLTATLLDNVEVRIRNKKHRIICSMDGEGIAKVGRFKGREFGYELKGRNGFTYVQQLSGGADDKTRAQVDFEFLMSGHDLFVVMNENKNNQTWQEWVFVRDDDRVKAMANQIKGLNKAVDDKKLHPMLPECRDQVKNSEWDACPYGGRGGVCANAGMWPRGM